MARFARFTVGQCLLGRCPKPQRGRPTGPLALPRPPSPHCPFAGRSRCQPLVSAPLARVCLFGMPRPRPSDPQGAVFIVDGVPDAAASSCLVLPLLQRLATHLHHTQASFERVLTTVDPAGIARDRHPRSIEILPSLGKEVGPTLGRSAVGKRTSQGLGRGTSPPLPLTPPLLVGGPPARHRGKAPGALARVGGYSTRRRLSARRSEHGRMAATLLCPLQRSGGRGVHAHKCDALPREATSPMAAPPRGPPQRGHCFGERGWPRLWRRSASWLHPLRNAQPASARGLRRRDAARSRQRHRGRARSERDRAEMRCKKSSS